MENLNGLNFVRRASIEYYEIEDIIKNTLNCNYISLDIDFDDNMDVSFLILDKSKKEDIKNCFKKFLTEEELQYIGSFFEEIDSVCDEYLYDDLDEVYINIDSIMLNKIIEKYLNDKYNLYIRVIGIEDCYNFVGIVFEVEEERKLVVSTPKGDIVVSVEGDNDYPGVFVDFKGNDIKDCALTYSNDEISLARIEYDIQDKKLRTYLWETPGKEDPSYEAIYNDFLIFNEDFTILEEGTKIEYEGQVAYITGDDRDNCPDGYHDSLNYCIKYALENETYDDVLERIKKEDWYDDMILWHWAKVIKEEVVEN